MKRLLIAMFAVVLVLAACSGDDGGVLAGAGDGGGSTSDGTGGAGDGDTDDLDGDEKAAAERVAASIENDPEAPDVTPEQAECVGVRVVEAIGVERVEEIDWESDEVRLPEDDARGVAQAMVDCVDVRPLMVEGMTQDGDLTAEQAACLGDDLSDDELVELLTSAFVDGSEDVEIDPALYEPLADAMLNCMDFGALLVEEFTAAGDLSAESAQCLADGISDDLLRQVIVAGMAETDTSAAEAALAREVMAAAPECLTDEELSGLGG
jgi:hypothetical protein